MEKFTNWYLWYYIFLAFMGVIYVQQKNRVLLSEDGNNLKSEDDYRASVIFSILVFLPLVIIAGTKGWDLADKYGDTGSYITKYNNAPPVSEVWSNIDWDSRGPGFDLFVSFVKQITNFDYTGFFFIVAIIQTACLLISYRRYSSDIVVCAYLFFASTDFMSWAMNGLRQFLVVSIIFAIFPLVQKKKFIPFLLIVLVLFTVHKSVLLVIPLYFAALGKPFNKRTIAILVLVLVAILFVSEFTGFMDDSLQGTVYSNMVSEFEGDNGTNIIRAIVYSVPAFLAIFNRKKIDDNTPEIIKISVNMALFTAGLFFLSVPISGIFMGRLPIYCSLFNYILLPWELENFFGEENKKTLKMLMVVLYFAFYVCQMLQWGI